MEAWREEDIRGGVHESSAANKLCSDPKGIVASLKEPHVPAYVASDFAALSTSSRHCRAAAKRKFAAHYHHGAAGPSIKAFGSSTHAHVYSSLGVEVLDCGGGFLRPH